MVAAMPSFGNPSLLSSASKAGNPSIAAAVMEFDCRFTWRVNYGHAWLEPTYYDLGPEERDPDGEAEASAMDLARLEGEAHAALIAWMGALHGGTDVAPHARKFHWLTAELPAACPDVPLGVPEFIKLAEVQLQSAFPHCYENGVGITEEEWGAFKIRDAAAFEMLVFTLNVADLNELFEEIYCRERDRRRGIGQERQTPTARGRKAARRPNRGKGRASKGFG